MRLPGLQYDSPLSFSAWQRLQLAVIPPVVAGVYQGLYATCRVRVDGYEYFQHTLDTENRVILALWHETTGLLACFHRGRNFHSTASYSFDGEMAARTIHYFGAETVRGSSSRGGSEALRELQKALGVVRCVGLTMDGPRGPRRQAKPGVAVLAARTRTKIVPNAAVALPSWRLRSWDRFLIPKPFAKVYIAFGPPIPPPPSDAPEDVEETRFRVEHALNTLQETLEQHCA